MIVIESAEERRAKAKRIATIIEEKLNEASERKGVWIVSGLDSAGLISPLPETETTINIYIDLTPRAETKE